MLVFSTQLCELLPQSPVTGKLFQMTTFCITFYESYLSTVAGKLFLPKPAQAIEKL
jgi:hypothetical protein